MLGWFLVLCVMVPQGAHGSPPGIIALQVQGMTDTARAQVLAHLARGDVAQAIHAYEVATGLKAPLWLTGFKAAFDASKQVPGACQEVARSIHAVFTYTGAAGLPWADYMSRLGAVTPIVEKAVVSP
jgi:hypothetical protein